MNALPCVPDAADAAHPQASPVNAEAKTRIEAMKTMIKTLLATSLMLGAAVPAFAESSESPSYVEQMTNLWIATGDATYARQAGLTEAQIAATKRPPVLFGRR